MRKIFIDNWQLKLISVLLALAAWWLIRAERESEPLRYPAPVAGVAQPVAPLPPAVPTPHAASK